MAHYKFNLNKKELSSLRRVFQIYDDGTGHIDPSKVAEEMKFFGIDEKNPVAYKLVCDLGKEDCAKDGIDYEDMITCLQNRMADRKSDDAINMANILITRGPANSEITYEEIERTGEDVGDNTMNADEAKNLIKRAAENGDSMGYEEFSAVMRKEIHL